MRAALATAVIMVMATASSGLAQTLTPIRHTLRLLDPEHHYIEVETVIPTDSDSDLELMMAVWTPGSYLVREYARNVEGLAARGTGGNVLPVEQTRKNRWRIGGDGNGDIVVTYRVYCREMSVRTNWVDDEFALINGAPTFLTIVGDLTRPHDVRLELPQTWLASLTSLPPTPDGAPHSYRAADFDTLVDSPIVAGNPAVRTFEVDGVPHVLASVGGDGVWQHDQAAADVKRIVEAHRKLWGFLPYDRYLVLNLITESRGGIEHKDSTVLMTSRWQMRDREGYLRWLTTVSHELFHAWNVKRLRPVELGPFDYESEVHTRSLWVAEGLTVYYGALLVRRAGLSSRDEYLDELSSQIRQLQTAPGRRVQSVEQASYDAWIKYYRRNENSTNTTISYYTKGGVIGFLLDAKIRELTDGRRSLDDVMRLAYRRFSGATGFTPAEFRATTEEIAGVSLDAWFVSALESVDELDYTQANGWFGLELSGSDPARDSSEGPPVAWLGATTRDVDGRLVVATVPRDTPAYDAALNVGDEIVALDGYRVYPEVWTKRLRLYRAKESATLLVARRERLVEVRLTFGAQPDRRWKLSVAEGPDQQTLTRLERWLGS